MKIRHQQMWYGSWDKVLYRYNTSTNVEDVFETISATNSFFNDEISDIAEDNHGRLWFAGRNAGLQMLDKTTNKFYHFRFDPALAGTIADDRVNCIFLDNAGHIWAGTNKGISIARLEQQFVQQFLPGAFKGDEQPISIYDFYKDQKQSLWLGTSKGIYYLQQGSTVMQHIPIRYKGEELSVTKFFMDEEGDLYLGTNYSLFRYNATDQAITLLPNTEQDKVMNRIIESRIVSAISDTVNDHPVLMVSPYGHYLAYYDLVDKQWVSRVDTAADIVRQYKLKDNLIRKFYRGKNGQVWLAMAAHGLGLWEKSPQPVVQYFSHNLQIHPMFHLICLIWKKQEV